MTLPELLKEAYNNKDWDKVVEALSMLGVVIEIENTVVGPTPKKRGRKIKAVEFTPQRKELKPEDFTVENITKWSDGNVVIPNRPNKFDPKTVKEDVKDRKLDAVMHKKVYGEKTERRPPVETIILVCDFCQKKVEVFPSQVHKLADSQYRCEKCNKRN